MGLRVLTAGAWKGGSVITEPETGEETAVRSGKNNCFRKGSGTERLLLIISSSLSLSLVRRSGFLHCPLVQNPGSGFHPRDSCFRFCPKEQ